MRRSEDQAEPCPFPWRMMTTWVRLESGKDHGVGMPKSLITRRERKAELEEPREAATRLEPLQPGCESPPLPPRRCSSWASVSSSGHWH